MFTLVQTIALHRKVVTFHRINESVCCYLFVFIPVRIVKIYNFEFIIFKISNDSSRVLRTFEFFFKNPALWLFYLYSPLTSCKKSEKSLELFLRKPCYQTNQPTKTNLETFSRTSPNQEFFSKIRLCDFSTFIVP